MQLSLFLLWALAGWCGNEPRRWGFPPKPGPGPDPWWFASRIIGVVFGIIGGWGYTKIFGPHPEPWTSALPAAASAFGAFLAARFVTDVVSRFSGGNRT